MNGACCVYVMCMIRVKEKRSDQLTTPTRVVRMSCDVSYENLVNVVFLCFKRSFPFESYPTRFQNPKTLCMALDFLDSNQEESTRVFVIENFGGLESVWDLAFNVIYIGRFWVVRMSLLPLWSLLHSTILSSFQRCCQIEWWWKETTMNFLE